MNNNSTGMEEEIDDRTASSTCARAVSNELRCKDLLKSSSASVTASAEDETAGNEEASILSTISSYDTWEKMYQRLVEFRDKHGHCRVPYRYEEDPQLGAWVATQRRSYKLLKSGRRKKTPLSPEREKQLIEIGFEWSVDNPHIVSWKSRFMELLEFVTINGHTEVPTKWEENSQLSNWVSKQRREYQKVQMGKRSTMLTKERICLLNYIGFVWEAQRGGVKRIQNIRGCATTRNETLLTNSCQARAAMMLQSLKHENSSNAMPSRTTSSKIPMRSSPHSIGNTTMNSVVAVREDPKVLEKVDLTFDRNKMLSQKPPVQFIPCLNTLSTANHQYLTKSQRTPSHWYHPLSTSLVNPMEPSHPPTIGLLSKSFAPMDLPSTTGWAHPMGYLAAITANSSAAREKFRSQAHNLAATWAYNNPRSNDLLAPPFGVLHNRGSPQLSHRLDGDEITSKLDDSTKRKFSANKDPSSTQP